ncbi:MAG: FAD-dependent oxidoreductase [Clostridia bacterium]|nr:FAD-dependent oxidoreductase [Clostridia bacterium]
MNNTVLKISKEVIFDTVIIGGGLAGCGAAIASARNGDKTLLVEASGVLGGQATLGLVTPLDARFTKSGKSFGGIMEEISEKTIKLTKEYCSCGVDGKISHIASPHILKYVLVDIVEESGADIYFHTTILSANTDGDNITSVILSGKSGLIKVNAKCFIDATGDADLVYLSGAEYVLGSEPGVFEQLSETGLNKSHFSDNEYSGYSHDGLMQPVSIFILMGNVDVDKAVTFNNKDLKFGDLGITKEKFLEWKFANTCGFEVSGDSIPMPQGRVLVTRSTRPDIAVINMSRVVGVDGSDADDLNDGEIKAQKQTIAIVDFLKTFIPGFEDSYYIQSGATLGVRETRRMVGEYVLSGMEAINCKAFDNPIARGSYIIDIHDPSGRARAIGGDIKGDYYDIPYGCLISKTYNNLLSCGRCISVDHIAHSSTRIQGTCIQTGQAAGTAAAIANANGISPKQLDTNELHQQLLKAGMYL